MVYGISSAFEHESKLLRDAKDKNENVKSAVFLCLFVCFKGCKKCPG